MRIWKQSECSLSISLLNINKCNTLSYNTNRIGILKNNNTLHKGGVETLEAEDNNKEDDLVGEEAKPYVIIVGIQNIFSRDCQIPTKACTYCKEFDHTVEQCP